MWKLTTADIKTLINFVKIAACDVYKELHAGYNEEIYEEVFLEKRKEEARVRVESNSDFTTVEIIGTSAIPEFELVGMVLAATILPIILVSRKIKSIFE